MRRIGHGSRPRGLTSTEGPGLLDVVVLLDDHDGWSAGTEGTIVETYDEGALVEMADDEGRTLALLSVPYSDIALARDPQAATPV